MIHITLLISLFLFPVIIFLKSVGFSHVFPSLFSSVSTGLSVYRDKYTLSNYAAAGGESRGLQWGLNKYIFEIFIFPWKAELACLLCYN